jgi:ArsR family transcriptional regulator
MSSPSPKRLLYSHFAALARGLGHEHRLELIEHLGQGERSVETLAERTGLAFANVSQHLQQLRRLGVVAARRDGKRVLYRLADAPVVEALAALRTLAEHAMAEVRDTVATYFSNLDAMEPVGQDELLARLNDGTATLLDVRPEDEYGLGHLPGAVNIDLEDLEARLTELPRDKPVVAYCRGSYCVLSYHAVQLLRSRGFDARRLEDGFPEWKAGGRPVEAGAA